MADEVKDLKGVMTNFFADMGKKKRWTNTGGWAYTRPGLMLKNSGMICSSMSRLCETSNELTTEKLTSKEMPSKERDPTGSTEPNE